MRDLLVLGIVLASLPVSFFRPYIGVYFWFWLAFMNPQRFTWTLTFRVPLAQYVAIATLLGFVFMKQRPKLPKGRETLLLLLLCVLFTSNTLVAIFPDLAWKEWEEVMKVMLMTFVTLWLIDSKEKLRYLLFVITLSIGFFALKAVPWAIATNGQYLLYGPDGTFIGANNSLGMALNMIMPLMLFQARSETNRLLSLLSYAMFFSSIGGVILTYSRGALLGLSAVVLMLVFRSKRRSLALIGLFLAVSLMALFVPDKWFNRMETIWSYEGEQSAMSRIETWRFAWDLALERPFTGGGFQAFRANPTDFDAHSNYFGMVAEQGIIGLGLYLALILSCFFALTAIKKASRHDSSQRWYADLASMIQVSIVAYLVNGLTINRQYFDLFYLLVAIIAIMRALTTTSVPQRPDPLSAAPSDRAFPPEHSQRH